MAEAVQPAERTVKSVQTKSDKIPQNMAVTRKGGLVYADYINRSMNLVSGTQIEPLMTLQAWKPCGLCSTYSRDRQDIMNSGYKKQTKVVNYSCSKEIQCI